MSDDRDEVDPAQRRAIAQLLQPSRFPFGPRFFLEQLAAFLRDRCPGPSERLPRLELWLSNGDAVTVCHVIAVAPQWVAVAAGDRESPMRTELVPYELIARVTIGARPTGGIGFDISHRPLAVTEETMSPEEALATAAASVSPRQL